MVRDKILEAAVSVFSRKGYHPASVDEIALAAGVAKGSIYYHFRGKSELFTAVIHEGIVEIHRQVGLVLATATDARSVLSAFITGLLQTCIDYPDMVDLIMEERVGDMDPETGEQVRQARADFASYAASLIDEGIREGLLKSCNSQSVAAGAIAFVYAYFKTAHRLGRSRDEIVQETTDFILQGLERL
jgi:AcrR family transcriptional regulator